MGLVNLPIGNKAAPSPQSVLDKARAAAGTATSKAIGAARKGAGVLSREEQAQTALELAQANPEQFVRVVEQILREDPETAVEIILMLIERINPTAAEELRPLLLEYAKSGERGSALAAPQQGPAALGRGFPMPDLAGLPGLPEMPAPPWGQGIPGNRPTNPLELLTRRG